MKTWHFNQNPKPLASRNFSSSWYFFCLIIVLLFPPHPLFIKTKKYLILEFVLKKKKKKDKARTLRFRSLKLRANFQSLTKFVSCSDKVIFILTRPVETSWISYFHWSFLISSLDFLETVFMIWRQKVERYSGVKRLRSQWSSETCYSLMTSQYINLWELFSS